MQRGNVWRREGERCRLKYAPKERVGYMAGSAEYFEQKFRCERAPSLCVSYAPTVIAGFVPVRRLSCLFH